MKSSDSSSKCTLVEEPSCRIYESLKEDKRETYECARDSLIMVMQPVKLDSYRRSQFNRRQQKAGESVSDLAEALQRLMTQAFTRSLWSGAQRQNLLGQFEQGLLAKWKKHLKYPLETLRMSSARLEWQISRL